MKKKMLKSFILNITMKSGKKCTAEKTVLKSFKLLQKQQFKKNYIFILKSAIINSAPIFKLKKLKKKRKLTIEFPFLLNNRLKISSGIKNILKQTRKKNSLSFYNNFNLEMVKSSQLVGESTKLKKEVHQTAFLKKKFINYMWF
jgi:ribosomal protein S7